MNRYKKGDPVPAALNLEAFGEWVEYRLEKKKPLSDLAKTKVINRLIGYSHNQQQIMVDVAISNDWVGIHEVAEPKKASVASTRNLSIAQMLTDTSWAD